MNNLEKQYQFKYNQNNYLVTVKKKSIKRIIIKVNSKNGIFIHCPLKCNFDDAYHYLEEHRNWLEKVLAKQEITYQNYDVEACMNYQKIWLQGRLYLILIKPDLEEPFKLENDILFVKGNLNKVILRICESLYDVIFDEFHKCLNSFQTYITQKPYLEIKKMKSRWGSCNFKTGRIVINKRLIHTPKELLHYVMVHEFVHLLYPNHQKQFYEFIKQILPNYKKCEKELKNYSFLLQLN